MVGVIVSAPARACRLATECGSLHRRGAVAKVRLVDGADRRQIRVASGDLADDKRPRPVVAGVVVEREQGHLRAPVEMSGHAGELGRVLRLLDTHGPAHILVHDVLDDVRGDRVAGLARRFPGQQHRRDRPLLGRESGLHVGKVEL